MEQKSIDLVTLFQTVKDTLQTNRKSLNDADTQNHDHGDNMVDTFEVITRAMKEKQGDDPADQLAYASQLLRQRKSGSAQVYANGLAQASKEFQGQQVTPNNAMNLIQALLDGGQPVQQARQQQSGEGIGSLIGNLLGGTQQQTQPRQDKGLDMGDLLQAGMTFMGTKARGGSNLEAIVNALVSNSAMSGTYRSQSGSLVASTLLNAIMGKLGK